MAGAIAGWCDPFAIPLPVIGGPTGRALAAGCAGSRSPIVRSPARVLPSSPTAQAIMIAASGGSTGRTRGRYVATLKP